jgi:BASS family bile acid:Na+ symporter
LGSPLDTVELDFGTNSLWVLNLSLAIIMFGVALNLTVDDFRRVFKNPKSPLLGMLSQFFVLPALTYCLVLIIEPAPSIAMGMILVAACPGGNISNFISHLAGANTALSVSLTAISTVAAIIMTPFNLQFWASLYGPTNDLLREISIDHTEVLKAITLLLGIPLIIGMVFRAIKPDLAQRISVKLKPVSVLIFISFVLLAFAKNYQIFIDYFQFIIFIVFIHNTTALSSGYLIGRIFKLPFPDQKTLAIETGIQNSGLGLLLIFTFFNGLGGMAIIAAWWGIWHIVSGLTIAYFWAPSTSRQSAQ